MPKFCGKNKKVPTLTEKLKGLKLSVPKRSRKRSAQPAKEEPGAVLWDSTKTRTVDQIIARLDEAQNRLTRVEQELASLHASLTDLTNCLIMRGISRPEENTLLVPYDDGIPF